MHCFNYMVYVHSDGSKILQTREFCDGKSYRNEFGSTKIIELFFLYVKELLKAEM